MSRILVNAMYSFSQKKSRPKLVSYHSCRSNNRKLFLVERILNESKYFELIIEL